MLVCYLFQTARSTSFSLFTEYVTRVHLSKGFKVHLKEFLFHDVPLRREHELLFSEWVVIQDFAMVYRKCPLLLRSPSPRGGSNSIKDAITAGVNR